MTCRVRMRVYRFLMLLLFFLGFAGAAQADSCSLTKGTDADPKFAGTKWRRWEMPESRRQQDQARDQW